MKLCDYEKCDSSAVWLLNGFYFAMSVSGEELREWEHYSCDGHLDVLERELHSTDGLEGVGPIGCVLLEEEYIEVRGPLFEYNRESMDMSPW